MMRFVMLVKRCCVRTGAVLLLAASMPSRAVDLTGTVWAATAQRQGLDPTVLYAVAVQETQRPSSPGAVSPWPWTLRSKVSPLGNPAMPMEMPVGPEWLRRIDMPIPKLVAGNLPGFESIATALLEQTAKAKGVPSIKELRDICVESEVRLLACRMTVDLFNYRQDEFIPEIAEWIGATSYLAEARKADVCLFI